MLIVDGGVVDGGPIEGCTTLLMHMFIFVVLGMLLIDGVDFEVLADVVTWVNCWEFMFIVVLLFVDNGVGLVVNLVVIF